MYCQKCGAKRNPGTLHCSECKTPWPKKEYTKEQLELIEELQNKKSNPAKGCLIVLVAAAIMFGIPFLIMKSIESGSTDTSISSGGSSNMPQFIALLFMLLFNWILLNKHKNIQFKVETYYQLKPEGDEPKHLNKTFCPECETELSKLDKFCGNCGYKVLGGVS
jgi:ribosomal protein L40E